MGNVHSGFTAIFVIFISLLSSNAFAHKCGDRYFGQERYSLPQARNNSFDSKKLNTNTNLKIATWNLYEFKLDLKLIKSGRLPFQRVDAPENKIRPKGQFEILQYVKALEQMNADVLVLQEADLPSVQFFVKRYLNDEYTIASDKSRPVDRLQTLVLVRRHLLVDIEVQSFNHHKWNGENHEKALFSNGLFAVHLKTRGNNLRPSQSPEMIVFGAHFKSNFGWRVEESEARRAAQMQKTAEIIQEMGSKHPKTPILLAGDFNADPILSQEAAPLRFIMKDSLQSSGKSNDRFTRDGYYHGEVTHTQLDGQMMNQNLTQKLKNSYVLHLDKADPSLNASSNARSGAQRINPSDHEPVVAEYDMTRE